MIPQRGYLGVDSWGEMVIDDYILSWILDFNNEAKDPILGFFLG